MTRGRKPDGILPLPRPNPVAHVTLMRGASPQFVGFFVEGVDDVRVWKRWVKWAPYDSGGRAGVLDALRRLSAGNIHGCVGLIDADFGRVENTLPSDPNVVVTERHDCECDVVCSPALDRMLATHADQMALEGRYGNVGEFRNILAKYASAFGCLRWYWLNLGREWPSGRLSAFQFVDSAGFDLDGSKLIREASAAIGLSQDEIEKSVGAIASRTGDVWQICNGHDVVALICIALKGVLRTNGTCQTGEQVRSSLWLALDSQDLPNLAVWRSLKAWELNNSPFILTF